MERGEKQGQDRSPGRLAVLGSLSLCCRQAEFQSLSFRASDDKMMLLAEKVRETSGLVLAI